jgi:hypothetical protein
MSKLILIALAVAACTPTPKRPTTPTEYACSSRSIIPRGSEVTISGTDAVARLHTSDSAGDHFVAFPSSPADHTALEFVLPEDPRLDAEERTYDASFGSSEADWRLTNKGACTAGGGYNDVLVRYIKGATLEDLTRDLALDSTQETRALIHRAMLLLQKRYYRDR